jgi:hypothetical protein
MISDLLQLSIFAIMLALKDRLIVFQGCIFIYQYFIFHELTKQIFDIKVAYFLFYLFTSISIVKLVDIIFSYFRINQYHIFIINFLVTPLYLSILASLFIVPVILLVKNLILLFF